MRNEECSCRIICHGPKWTLKIVYCPIHDRAHWMRNELDRLGNLEGDVFDLLQLCKSVKDYLDHPDQKNTVAWNLIGRIEDVLEKDLLA